MNKIIDFIEYNEDTIKERLKEPIPYSEFPDLILPKNFVSTDLEIRRKSPYSDLRDQIEPISKNIEKHGFPPNVYTALYESSLNAFQHGNNYDFDKRIRVSHLIKKNSLELIIEDQGDELPEYFIPFLLKVRKETSKKRDFVDWYAFSCNEKNNVNHGTGTSFIHAYMDDVRYLRSNDLGGLAVYLLKEK